MNIISTTHRCLPCSVFLAWFLGNSGRRLILNPTFLSVHVDCFPCSTNRVGVDGASSLLHSCIVIVHNPLMKFFRAQNFPMFSLIWFHRFGLDRAPASAFHSDPDPSQWYRRGTLSASRLPSCSSVYFLIYQTCSNLSFCLCLSLSRGLIFPQLVL